MSEPQFVLAPMDGMTRASFRRVCFDYGADGATTEMIQSLALGRAKRKLSPTFAETMARLPGEGNLAAQLIGSVPAMMGASARKLTDLGRFNAIDINMGCPARTVVGSGNGSALLKNPTLAMEVMRAVRESTDLPVRLKLRLGWDGEHITAPELVAYAEALGFESITLHGRTRMQMYSGKVDLPAMRAIIGSVSIPVFANGAVTCARDALSFLEATGAAGVSIGRAALKQPWIFEDIRRLRAGLPLREHNAGERVQVLIRLATLACGLRPEAVAISEMRKFSGWLLAGLTNAPELLTLLNSITTLDAYREALERYLNKLAQTGDIHIHPEKDPSSSLDTVDYRRR